VLPAFVVVSLVAIVVPGTILIALGVRVAAELA
jgi:hypothetical protein